MQYGAVNLSQGFPDFDPPKALLDRLAEVSHEDFHQYSITWGAQKFREALAWSMSMSGKKFFALEIVPSASFEPPEGAEFMLATARKGDRGWFAVDNRYALAPTELEMLKADIAQIGSEYDHVFILQQGGMRRGGSFMDQLLEICDSALVVAGAGKSPRSWLSYILKHIHASGKPAMSLATGAKKKIVRTEMEAKG